MPSTWSTVLSTAARRASVSRLPSPASTRRRGPSRSSTMMSPEVRDAKMETRKPIASPSKIQRKEIFRIMPQCPTRCPTKSQWAATERIWSRAGPFCGIGKHPVRRMPYSLRNGNGDILPPQTMEKYDLIVVGSGPGGQRAAIQAAKFGKRAALIEKLEVIGGTAINTGTIPSKTIREAVLHLSGYQYQSIYGVNYRVKEPITMADLSFRGPKGIKTEMNVIGRRTSRSDLG